MAEVPDHLAPKAAETDSTIRFAGIDVTPGGALARFDLTDLDGDHLAVFKVPVSRRDGSSFDSLVQDAHVMMADLLRQWLFEVVRMRQEYEMQALNPNP